METPNAYPLQWPNGAPRTKSRRTAQFRTTLNGALKNVRESLTLFGKDTGKPVSTIVLSSNVALGSEKPDDTGVAVWFIWADEWRCIPVDRYTKPEWNLQAIHHILEARRVEFRHGGLHIAKSAFAGFTTALEGPGSVRSWRAVMGFMPDYFPSPAELTDKFRALSKLRHPDSGTGSTALMAELNVAYETAKKELT